MKSGALSWFECRRWRDDTYGTGRPKTASFSAAHFVSVRARTQRRLRQLGFVHLNIVNLDGPQASRNSSQIRRIRDLLVTQQL